jgi:dihydropteroate synthase
MPALARLGRPILAGVSRKSFLKPSGDLRDATVAAIAATVLAGAHIVRVHSVAQAKAAVQIADAILRAV